MTTNNQSEQNAAAFAAMMGETPQEPEEQQRIPAAPRAPESRIIHEAPSRSRMTTADQFAAMFRR